MCFTIDPNDQFPDEIDTSCVEPFRMNVHISVTVAFEFKTRAASICIYFY